MEEETLKRIAIVTSLLGIIILFLILKTEDIEESSPLLKDDNKPIKLTGTVEKIGNYRGMTRLSLRYDENIDIVIFEEKNLSHLEGRKITVEGKINIYEGSRSILPDEIRIKG